MCVFVTRLTRVLSISGSNFDSAVGVRIAGVPCVVHEVMGNTLIVEAPALDDDGFKDVELYDLDDERPVVRLPGMLMYRCVSCFLSLCLALILPSSSAQDFRDPAEIALEAALASSDEDENYDEWDSFLETLPSVTITSLNPVVRCAFFGSRTRADVCLTALSTAPLWSCKATGLTQKCQCSWTVWSAVTCRSPSPRSREGRSSLLFALLRCLVSRWACVLWAVSYPLARGRRQTRRCCESQRHTRPSGQCVVLW